MKTLITIPVIFDKLTTTNDKSFKITLETQDKGTLTSEQKSQLMDMLGEYLWVGISRAEQKIDDLDIPDIKPDFRGEKSPSARLRAVLFILWEKSTKTEEFETFYRRQIEKLIDRVKEKLE